MNDEMPAEKVGYAGSLKADMRAAEEKCRQLGLSRFAASSAVTSLCLDSMAGEYLKRPFDFIGAYRMYFILKAMSGPRHDCLLVSLDKNYMPLKTLRIGTALFEDAPGLATFIDANVPAGTRSVIVSKYDPTLRFESELFFANELYDHLTKVKLHDYVLVTAGACRSVMSSFR